MRPRIEVARSDIKQVVNAFYARVRAHPVLAQVFARHIDDWPAHEEKIIRFWANALLFEGDYDGNPMQAHMQAQTVKPVHFDHWLGLFDDTLYANLLSHLAIQWSLLAHRIGRGLSMVSRIYIARRVRPLNCAKLIGFRHAGTAKIERATPIMGWNRGPVGRDFSVWESDRRNRKISSRCTRFIHRASGWAGTVFVDQLC